MVIHHSCMLHGAMFILLVANNRELKTDFEKVYNLEDVNKTLVLELIDMSSNVKTQYLHNITQ